MEVKNIKSSSCKLETREFDLISLCLANALSTFQRIMGQLLTGTPEAGASSDDVATCS